MSNMTTPNACPFCSSSNNCGVNREAACWCNNVEIPAQLIDLLPAEAKNKACICLECINTFTNDPTSFTAKHSGI